MSPAGAGFALSFANANHTYVDVPDSPSLHVDTTFTLEAWIYQTAAQYNGYRLIDKITAGVGGGFLFDTYDPNGSGHRLRLCGTGGCAYSNVLYSLNQWHHVAAVVAGSMATIYLDGQQVGSGTVGGGGSQANTLDLHIGAPHVGCGGGCGTSEYFNGTIDEVRIWNVARTQQQIQGAINSSLTGAESGLVGYWRFDDGSGTRTADTSGHNNNGTLVNSPTWVSSTAPIGPPPTTFVPGAPNVAAAAALTFGGMYNNFVDVPNSANFDFPAGLTIEAWIYQTQAQSNGYRVVDKTTAGGGEGSFILDTYDPNGSGRRLRFCASSPSRFL